MNPADALGELVGGDRVTTGEATRRFATDWSPRAQIELRSGVSAGLPDCVVAPRATAEVAAILEWADATKTPVVPFGGGSGVCEGIRPSGAVVVALTEMAEILDVDPKSRLVRVQAGVMGPDLERALRSEGLKLGHEPQSIALSTVGGWVATRASGQLSSRYGGIERLIAGLEAVLPGGRVVRSAPVPRRAAGPDVASLMIGSEGTLGIVTEVTLRMSPADLERVDACIRFEHMADGVAACRAIAQSETNPSLVRLYDTEDSEIFLRSHPDEPRGPLLLLSFEGDRAAERTADAVALTRGAPGNTALVEHWWQHRNDAANDYRELMSGRGLLGPHALVESIEVAGTWSVLRDIYHGMKEELSAISDIAACHLSHVYPDGACLYFVLASACDSDEAATKLYDEWWGAAMRTCLDNGGSISHHHGIGRLKARWLPQELDGWFEVLRTVKAAIDPHRIMNPGVLGL